MDNDSDPVVIPAGYNKSLLDLPPEIFHCIANEMKRKDRASLLRTCKAAYCRTAKSLYWKIYTKRGTTSDITALPDFFARRRDLISLVKVMVIDEYDEAAFRQLLSISFPKLESIILQHEGDVEKQITEEEKALLNQGIQSQPKLQNLTFSIERSGRVPHHLTNNDIPIFLHRAITRLRLSYLDFSTWEDLSLSTFDHVALDTLDIECSVLPPTFYSIITKPTKVLTHIRLDATTPSPQPLTWLPPSLTQHIRTLKILKIVAHRFTPIPTALNLSHLTNLRLLHICPKILLGPSYTSDPPNPQQLSLNGPDLDSETLDLHALLRTNLPPNLVILSLDNIVSKNLAIPPEGMGYPIRRLDERLIYTVIVNRRTICPHLSRIYMFYCEHIANTDLYDIAKEYGLYLVPMYNVLEDVVGPAVEELEKHFPRVKIEEDDENEAGEDVFVGKTNPFGWI